MTPIKLTQEQQFDLELALATHCFDGIDADCAAYVSYQIEKCPIPDNKILARICEGPLCVNPEHLALIDDQTTTACGV